MSVITPDSFDRLLAEIFKEIATTRDGFALLGLLWCAKTTYNAGSGLYKALKHHAVSRLVPVNLVRKYGPWAVVTGCTEGIGRAFVQELASRGLHCILVSRNPTKLNSLAQDIENTYHIQTATIVVDFNNTQSVYSDIAKGIEGKDIGVLVNNVGVNYDYPMNFLDVTSERLWQLMNINMAATTMMTHLVLPRMVAKKRGAIINMSSGAGFKPSPLITVYSATKTYVDCFSRALSYEYRSKGITVQSLCPYYISTHMTAYSCTMSKPSMLIPSAQTFVRHALATLGWTNRTTGYLPHTVLQWMANLVPESLWLWGSMLLNGALQRQAHQRMRHRSGSRPLSRPPSQLIPSSSSSANVGQASGTSGAEQKPPLPISASLESGVSASSSSEYVDAPSC